MRRALTFWALFVVLLGGWALLLRPPALGGATSYVFVRGQSMLPTHAPGDLVMVRHRSAYRPGMVVAFRPSEDTPGVVIHRVVSERDGRLITRGDNLDADDPWQLRPDQVLGQAVAGMPRVGLLVASVANPLTLGLLCGVIVALFAMTSPPPAGWPLLGDRRSESWYVELDPRGGPRPRE